MVKPVERVDQVVRRSRHDTGTVKGHADATSAGQAIVLTADSTVREQRWWNSGRLLILMAVLVCAAACSGSSTTPTSTLNIFHAEVTETARDAVASATVPAPPTWERDLQVIRAEHRRLRRG
jgi:hypothetical protein